MKRKTLKCKIFPHVIIFFCMISILGCERGRRDSDLAGGGISSGRFIDSAVEGLEFLSGNKSGITDADGTFQVDGVMIQFSIGDIILGEGAAKSVMTPIDLVPGAIDEADPRVINITRFLLALDDDWNPGNGIQIREGIRNASAGKFINFTQSIADFESDLNVQLIVGELTALTASGARNLVSAPDAQEHLRNTLLGIRSFALTITTAGDGSGVIISHLDELNCESDCVLIYPEGTPVALLARPRGDATFSGWTGDADCADGVISMTSNKTCIATFSISSGTMSLYPGSNLPAGERPVSVAVSDLNGDGFLDLLTANQLSDDVSVFLVNGNGTFQAQQRFPVGDGPLSLVVADLNGDGRFDLATANQASDDISVLLGKGDGTFQAQRRFSVGKFPLSVIAVDLNGDGLLDLVTSNGNSANVSILLSQGDGTFQTKQDFSAGDGAHSVAAADLNGDGLLDLITANKRSEDISVLLSNGDGTFQKQKRFPAGDGPVFFDGPLSVAVAELNGDGFVDLVTANRSSGDISVLLGKGDGTFKTQKRFLAGDRGSLVDGPLSVVVADFNQDGIPDLVTANGHSADVSVLLGHGDGTFEAQQRFLVIGFDPSLSDNGPRSLAVGDLNGDGLLDLVTANGGSDNISVLLGNGDTLQAQRHFPAGKGSGSLVVADLNGDGHPDLVTVNELSAGISVLLGNSSGAFEAHQDFPARDGANSVSVGDLNGDGHLDLVTANGESESVSVLLSNGDGTFKAPANFDTGNHPTSVVIGDLNDDGHLDLALASTFFSNVSVLLSNGDDTFQEPQLLASGNSPRSLAMNDLNGDGHLDLLTVNEVSDDASVLLGHGDGRFEAQQRFPVGNFPQSVKVVDLDGDGHFDLITANGGSDDISVLLGHGDGSFQAHKDFPAGKFPVSVAVADLNGDGLLDLITANGSSDDISLLLSHGDGTFQAHQDFPVDAAGYLSGGGPRSLAVADLNGDGLLDLLTANPLSGNVSVLLHQ